LKKIIIPLGKEEERAFKLYNNVKLTINVGIFFIEKVE